MDGTDCLARKYRILTLLSLTVSAALLTATGASASSVKDPRVCSWGPARKADCARSAASLVSRKFLARKVGSQVIWQGPMICTAKGSMLRWSCSFTSSFSQLPAKGHVLVVYRALSSGWTVTARITP